MLDEDDIQRLEERLDAAAEVRRAYRALGRLSEEDRAVLELVSVDGMSVAEAAAALGIRPVAARVRLHRARRRLAKEVGSPVAEPRQGTRTGHVQAEAKA